MRLRRAARADSNQTAIVTVLRGLGALWIPVGHPFDGLTGWRRHWYPTEVKDGSKAPSRRKFTDDQLAFLRDCEAYSLPVLVLTDPETVYAALKGLE